jgi:hypothetical protein
MVSTELTTVVNSATKIQQKNVSCSYTIHFHCAFVGGCWFTLAHQQHSTPWPHKLAIDLKLEGQKFVVVMRIWGFLVMVLTRTTPTKGSVREELKGDLLLASNLKNDTNDSNFSYDKTLHLHSE